MKRKLLMAVCAGLIMTGAIAVACGDDDDEGAVPTLSNAGATTTSAAGNVTPFPTGEVTAGNITSESKGYSATIPADWLPRFNLIQTADGSTDAFFEPLPPGAAAQANVSVTCVVDPGLPPDEYIDAQQTVTARLPLNEDITVSERTIDGVTVEAVSYTQRSQQNPDQAPVAMTDMFFSGSKCQYTLKTSSLQTDIEKYRPIFDAFIDSFRFEK
jgi:hypothetical protein